MWMMGMSAKKVRIGIAAKAIIFVTLLVALSSTVMISYNVHSERRDLLADTIVRASELARTGSSLAAPDIIEQNTDKLSRMFEEFDKIQPVNYVFAVGVNGRFLAGSDPSGDSAPATTVDALSARAWTTGDEVREATDGVLHIARPILHEGRVVGIFRMGMSLNHIDARIQAIVNRAVAIVTLGLAIITPLTGFMISLTIRPIRKLTAAAARITQRDFDIELDVRTGDELEVLAHSFNDMAEQMRTSMKRIRHLAFVDDLTRLPNKTGFTEHARRILANSDAPSAMLVIDLDRFKRLNDIYGPREGDRLLKITAQRLRASAKRVAERFRHPDARPPLLARLSGNEYALLLCGPSPTSAAKEAARDIIASINEPYPLNEGEARLTASVGIARSPFDARDVEELLRLANIALDAVKSNGGNGLRFFESEMTRRAVERITLENELRQAISNQDFVVHYQPKVDARSGEVTSCEALVRWNREGKIVGPGAFIETAEDCGLIAEIGDYVLNESCEAAARWRAAGLKCSVAVNVSAIQFELGGFSDRVLDILAKTGLPPELLELELTESVAMEDPDEVIRQVEPMRAKGVRFAIDDFGTGHSSLASLTRMPFDTFKIDQSFVRQMETDPSARVVVETILAMAKALGYDTVGEGVETPTQFAFLRLNGCTTAQGFYFGKPVPEADFVSRLTIDQRSPQRSPERGPERGPERTKTA